jgi:hypothetical protein
MENIRIPVLKGEIDLSIVKAYDTVNSGGNTIAKLNINGEERCLDGFSYPIYQDELLLVGEMSIEDFGVIPEHVRINVDLCTNLLKKKYIDNKDLKTKIAISVSSSKLYQVGFLKVLGEVVIEVGSSSYEFTDSFKRKAEQKNKADYHDSNLPYSEFV